MNDTLNRSIDFIVIGELEVTMFSS